MTAKAISLWRRMCRWSLRGNWRPGAHNIVMLIAQVVIIWTSAQRGMDYVKLPSPHLAVPTVGEKAQQTLVGIEASGVPLSLLGYSFLLPAGVAFVGLALGWSKPLAMAHLFIGTSYLVLGITFLKAAPVNNWLTALGGCGLLLVSAGLLVSDSRRIPDIIAVSLGILTLMVGGWLAADGMGYGYRTGNGFIGGAVLHYVFGFGTQVLARREARLRREEEEDFKELGL